jgi:anti-sigma factor RsiW
MRCSQVQKNLLSWFDKEMPFRDRERIEEHLAGCDSCRLQARAMRSLWDFVVPEPTPEIPSTFWPALRQRIRNRKTKTELIRFRPVRSFVRWVPAAAVAGLVVLAVWTGLFLGKVPGGDLFTPSRDGVSPDDRIPFETLALTPLDDMPAESLGGIYLALASEEGGSGRDHE